MPERLAIQIEFMRVHPELAAAGAAYEIIDGAGDTLDVVRPATDPSELRWRLLLGNTCAHGSMMLRRDAVLAAGAYDETLERAQDYDLWLRLSRSGGIGNLPDVLYRHRLRGDHVGLGATSAAQADAAARLMINAWQSLDSDASHAFLARAVAATLAGAASAADCADAVERAFEDEIPGVAGLVAWLWARERASRGAEAAREAGTRARLREVGGMLREAGADSIWIMGAGAHTRRVLSHAGDLDLPIAGIVDDARVGDRLGTHAVKGTPSVPTGCHVLISSDWHEDALWNAGAAMRERGVRVWRLYGDGSPAPGGPSLTDHRAVCAP